MLVVAYCVVSAGFFVHTDDKLLVDAPVAAPVTHAPALSEL